MEFLYKVMSLKKRMGKRGQEGFSGVGVVVGIVILVIAAILIILWYNGVFSGLDPGIILPSDAQQKAKACASILLNIGGITDYCTKFDEIESSTGKKWYVSCDYPGIQAEIEKAIEEDDNLERIECEGNPEQDFCQTMENEGKNVDEVIVNGRTCESLGVEKTSTASGTTAAGSGTGGTSAVNNPGEGTTASQTP